MEITDGGRILGDIREILPRESRTEAEYHCLIRERSAGESRIKDIFTSLIRDTQITVADGAVFSHAHP